MKLPSFFRGPGAEEVPHLPVGTVLGVHAGSWAPACPWGKTLGGSSSAGCWEHWGPPRCPVELCRTAGSVRSLVVTEFVCCLQ